MTSAVQVYRKSLADLLQRPSTFLQAVLRLSPAVLKYVAALLLLINVRSWPLVWHFNVLVLPVYEIRIQYWLVRAKLLFASRKRQLEAKIKFFNSLCPVGEDPTRYTVGVKEWAGPDDCDFNMHLSNSAYPKQLDAARFHAALKICPTFYRAGGWVPLAATHFKFIREIPLFARYEIRMTLAAWDEKWAYVVIRYVTQKKGGSSKKSVEKADIVPPSGDNAPFPALHTPVSGTSTPIPPNANAPSLNPAERIASVLPAEPDGATLNCISVCQLCFKVGRMTVPPAIVLALDGFSVPPPPGAAVTTYSRAHPPPSWVEAQKLVAPDVPKGHMRTLQAFLRGGWRDVPAGQRWWEDALGGEIEERRRRNLGLVHGVRTGLEGALETY